MVVAAGRDTPGQGVAATAAADAAQRGDVALLCSHDGFPATLGVCLGATVAAPAVQCGLAYVPLHLALRVWHIQHAFKCPL